MCDKENYNISTKSVSKKHKQTILNVLKNINDNKTYDNKTDVINATAKLTIVSPRSVYRFQKNGCTSPKKRGRKKCQPKFNQNDINIIDDIILNYNKQNKFPSKQDVFKKVKSNPKCELSFNQNTVELHFMQ